MTEGLLLWTYHIHENIDLPCVFLRSDQLTCYRKRLWQCVKVQQREERLWNSQGKLQMFLLVSGRHVGAHQTGHQHGVPNCNFPWYISWITRLWDIAQPCGFHTLFMYHSSTTYQFLDFIYWMVEDFIFLLAWRCVRWKLPIGRWTLLALHNKCCNESWIGHASKREICVCDLWEEIKAV